MDTLSKDEARARQRALRRAMEPSARQDQVDAAERHLLPWLADNAPRRTVASVLSFGAEPPTGHLLGLLHATGYRVLVPICEPGRRLSWSEWYPGVPTSRSRVAPVQEPVGERHGPERMLEVDVVLVPALAVDERGARLGQGGGYYDRFIASLDALARRPELVSLVFDHEVLPADSFEHDALDRRVDAVVTAAGIRRLGDGPPA